MRNPGNKQLTQKAVETTGRREMQDETDSKNDDMQAGNRVKIASKRAGTALVRTGALQMAAWYQKEIESPKEHAQLINCQVVLVTEALAWVGHVHTMPVFRAFCVSSCLSNWRR